MGRVYRADANPACSRRCFRLLSHRSKKGRKMKIRWLALAASSLVAVQSAGAQGAAPASLPAFAEPTISDDGTLFAVASGGDIWEAPAAGGIAHPLVTDAATEGRPLYSPDGSRLAFTSTRGGSNNIYVLTFATGAVTRITYAEAGEELDAWSADGKWLYFASGANDVGRVPDIFRVSSAGGTPVEVSREKYLAEFQAAPSPDGGTVALMARGISNGQWWRNGHAHIDNTEIWLKPVASGTPYRLLLADDQKHAWPMWSPDGAAITYMSTKSGSENLWRMPGAGGAAEQLTKFADGRLLYPSMAANGSAIVFERDMAVWKYDAQSGVAAPVAITLRGTSAETPRRHDSLSSFTRMALSPDGQKIAVIGHGEVFAVPAKDGGVAQRITTSVGAERELTWAPDSRRMLYITERGLDHRLAEYDAPSGRETLLTDKGIASVPAYAPDGKSAVYVLDDKELHLVTFAAGGKPASDRVLFSGAIATDERSGPRPVWSPDGQYIAFPVTDRRAFPNVNVVSAAGGETRPVSFLANGQMGGIAWSPDGKYILFDTAQRSEDSRIVRVDLLPHVPKNREDAFRDLFPPGTPPGSPSAPGDTTPSPTPQKPLPAAGKGKPAAAPEKPKPAPVTIVWEGLRARATILPLGLSADTPVISADGKTLVFSANDRDQTNLYSYNLDELAAEPPVPQQISQSDKAKGDFALSGDGKTLIYLDGGKVMTTALEGPKPMPVAIAADMEGDFAAEN